MGGPVAQLAWHRHRDRVAGLVLCATSRDFSGTPRERMAFAVMPGLSAAMRVTPPSVRRGLMGTAIANRLGDGPVARWATNELARNDPATMMAAAAALGRFSSRNWIGDVDVPAAVVVTMRDSARATPPPAQAGYRHPRRHRPPGRRRPRRLCGGATPVRPCPRRRVRVGGKSHHPTDDFAALDTVLGGSGAARSKESG